MDYVRSSQSAAGQLYPTLGAATQQIGIGEQARPSANTAAESAAKAEADSAAFLTALASAYVASDASDSETAGSASSSYASLATAASERALSQLEAASTLETAGQQLNSYASTRLSPLLTQYAANEAGLHVASNVSRLYQRLSSI